MSPFLAKRSRIKPRETFWADEEKISFPILRDLLSLVDRKLTRAEFSSWSRLNRGRASSWASAVHLRASDNSVKVPREPAWVRRLPRCA